ncbi:MAG: efflux RND transporter periplasmic adaptor subunit [Thiohalocapsa sp.]|nr:efflux RND transporter periplasmic adaptor subunit [Thiohalocapsa sp.]
MKLFGLIFSGRSAARRRFVATGEAGIHSVAGAAVAVGLLGGLLGGLLAGCGPGAAPEAPPEPPAVGVIEVTASAVNPYVEFVGKTRAAETVALRARVTGFLEERSFEEGAVVEAGDVLFKIEPQQYLATLAQAEAELAAAEASLNRAQVDLARYRELVEAKNVSQQKVDEAEAEVEVQKAAVETAQANVEKARLSVGYTEITAPIGGRIDLAAFDVGNLVGPESGVLATINRMDPIKVTFSIAETWYLSLVQNSQQTEGNGDGNGNGGDDSTLRRVPMIKLPGGSLYAHRGRFDFVDNKVDERTGTVLIRAEFPNPDRLLLPGQFVTVVVAREDAVEAVTIPQAAVLTDQGGAYVLEVDDEDKVRARRIEIGQRFGPDVVVTQGLEAGTRIVLYGIQKVRPGIAVKPEPAAAPVDPMAASMPDLQSGGATEQAPTPASTDARSSEGPAADAAGAGDDPAARAAQ